MRRKRAAAVLLGKSGETPGQEERRGADQPGCRQPIQRQNTVKSPSSPQTLRGICRHARLWQLCLHHFTQDSCSSRGFPLLRMSCLSLSQTLGSRPVLFNHTPYRIR